MFNVLLFFLTALFSWAPHLWVIPGTFVWLNLKFGLCRCEKSFLVCQEQLPRWNWPNSINLRLKPLSAFKYFKAFSVNSEELRTRVLPTNVFFCYWRYYGWLNEPMPLTDNTVLTELLSTPNTSITVKHPNPVPTTLSHPATEPVCGKSHLKALEMKGKMFLLTHFQVGLWLQQCCTHNFVFYEHATVQNTNT